MPQATLIFEEIVLVSFVGAAIALDRVAAFQVMISRPIVASPLVGLMLGDTMTGLKVGLVLELLWIGYLPIGAFVPPDETVVSILVTATAIISGTLTNGNTEEVIALSLAFTLPAAAAAQKMDYFVRRRNIHSARAADIAGDDLDVKGLGRECMRGLGRYYALYFFVVLIFLSVATAMTWQLYPMLPDYALSGLKRFYYLLPVLGAASLVSMVRIKNTTVMVMLSFAFTLWMLEVLS